MIIKEIPPHDEPIEHAVIGSMLINPACIPKVRKIMSAVDFYTTVNVTIAEAMFAMAGHVSLLTVSGQLKGDKDFLSAGGADYLAGIVAVVATSAGVESHAEMLVEMSRKRKVIEICTRAIERVYSNRDYAEVVSGLKAGIRAIDAGYAIDDVPLAPVIQEIYAEIENSGDGGAPIGILTGLEGIDSHIYGLEKKCTYYIKAQSGTGKSSLAINIATNAAMSGAGRVMYFSLESTTKALVRRVLSRLSRIPLTRLRTGNLYGEAEWESLAGAATTATGLSGRLSFSDAPIYREVEKLVPFCETVAMEDPISLVVIDYIQLMRTRQRFDSVHHSMAYISDELNFLAKTINAPVMVLSQINKETEMKESGSIRNNADNIWFVEQDQAVDDGLVTITAVKGKDSGGWKASLYFDRFTQQFSDTEEGGLRCLD